VRKEIVFEASDSRSGAVVTLTRSPLGAERAAMEVRERALELAGAFDEKSAGNRLPKEKIVELLTAGFDNPSLRRERRWLSVQRIPSISEYQGPGNQRYVTYAYDVEECSGKVIPFTKYDGTEAEDCDGNALAPQRHFVTVTVMQTRYTSMRGNYLNGATGEMSKLLETLWIMDVSAPASKFNTKLGDELMAVARSLKVTPPVVTEDDLDAR